MTLAFPDVSSWQAGLTIQPGTVAVLAKATEGSTYRDSSYEDFKAQAEDVGALFSAYHFLSQGNGAAQADFCHAVIGNTPTVVDMESAEGELPSLSDCLDFINRMREIGGRVWALYLPDWYWLQMRSPDLSAFRRLGIVLISSDYTGYSDTGPGWDSYGGLTPSIWQYTTSMPYGGMLIDFNAFRGSVADLEALITGDDVPTAEEIWSYKGNDAGAGGPDAPDVHQSLLTIRDGVAQLLDAVTGLAELGPVLERIATKIGA